MSAFQACAFDTVAFDAEVCAEVPAQPGSGGPKPRKRRFILDQPPKHGLQSSPIPPEGPAIAVNPVGDLPVWGASPVPTTAMGQWLAGDFILPPAVTDQDAITDDDIAAVITALLESL